MNIPKEFKQIIADTFYDKEVLIYNSTEEVGEELDVIKTKGTLKETLKCNVHQIGNKLVQQDYGLDIEADIMITCEETNALKGDLLEYANEVYTITEVLSPDSHTKIFAKVGVENG